MGGREAAVNVRKHRISLEKAYEICFDPFICQVDATDLREVREAAIGLTEKSSQFFFVHVERRDDAIGVVAARPATPEERRQYEHD